ncbi:MAG: hypothetical protein ACXWU1_05650, partial [Allosphingosinicella sp.]
SLTARIDGVEVQGARGDLVEISAVGSSTQDIEIHDSVFHNSHANIVPGGGGVLLAGGGSDIEVDFLIEGSSFRGADGNALSASYTQDNGAIQGRLEGNVIGINDGVQGVEGSSGGGVGIFASLQQSSPTGDASFAIAMVDNQVYDVAFGLAGIYLNSSGGGAANPAILEATLTGNTIAEMGDFSLAGLYAIVGGSAGSGDFAQMGLDLQDNVIDASGIDFANAVFLDQVSVDAHYYFPGYAGSPDGEFNSGTASADLDAFLSLNGNVLTNGDVPISMAAGGVYADGVFGVTGDPLVLAPWVP